jgi:hypothetical protein
LEDIVTQIIEKVFQIADGLKDLRRNEVNFNGGDGDHEVDEFIKGQQ